MKDKQAVVQALLSIAQDTQLYVSLYPNIDDLMYTLKSSEIKSRVNSALFGYNNPFINSTFTSKVQLIELSNDKNNALKLLEICSEILRMGQSLNSTWGYY